MPDAQDRAYLGLASITGLAGGDLEMDAASPLSFAGGQRTMLHNRFGPMVFVVGQNRNGSTVVQGELMSKLGDATGRTSAGTITAGSTTSATTSGLTADDHEGAIFWVLDNNDSAGAAPENEVSIVDANSATLITLAADYPLTTAIAASDTADLQAVYAFADAAADDEAIGCLGIVIATDGIQDNNFGFLQEAGVNSKTLMLASTGMTRGNKFIAAAARVTTAGAASPTEDIIGESMVTLTSDSVSDMLVSQLACGYSKTTYDIVVQNAAA